MRDLVSVVIPVFNGAEHLPETLASVQAQTHPRVEIIVVDDGSSDGTYEVARRHLPAVRVLQQTNLGPGTARNLGLAVARGEYIALLDHDDLWHPATLATQLEVARRHPDSGMVICDGDHFQGEIVFRHHLLTEAFVGRVLGSPHGELTGYFRDEIIDENPIASPAQTLIPRHVFDALGAMSGEKEECDDWDYYMRVAWRYPLTFHSRRLVRKRYLESNLSGPWQWRRTRHALQELLVLRRLVRTLPADQRLVIREHLRRKLQRWAWLAYDGRLVGSLPDERAFLLRALSIVGFNATAGVVLACLHLPQDLLRTLASGSKRLLQALRGLSRE